MSGRTSASTVRCVTLALDQVSLGTTPGVAVDPPLLVRLCGPYEDGSFVATYPEICLAVAGPAPAHVLGQVEAMVALALKTGGSGLNELGQSLARALARRVPGSFGTDTNGRPP
jgi:hypothetical protein